VKELIEYPLKHPEVYGWLGVDPPRGVLLHGPPGCGKTALANAIANECGVPFLKVSAPEVVSGMSGESEAKIRQLFQEAATLAPCIVFIDEIDAIAPKRENAQREMERRIVAQMLTCLDDLSGLGASAHGSNNVIDPSGVGSAENGDDDGLASLPPSKHVVVIGATNRPDSIDAALRRAGRFDREIALGIPSEASREAILRVLSKRLRLSGDFDFKAVARRTPGFVGADLAALMKEAAALAVKRIFDELDAQAAASAAAAAAAGVAEIVQEGEDCAVVEPSPVTRLGRGTLTRQELASLAITMADFEGAVSKVQPSVRREGFTMTPDVTWDDVGSLADIREELAFAITKPIAQPELFEAMGLRGSTGVLLFGPPGCGKTLVAKAAANESGANFISIKGPELLNKYVGESERAVRQVFSRARAASPCVLFFDEMDALAPRRGADSANASAERVVNQLLTEMDGMEGRQGVYLVAATNRPDMIDPALLRPGRLDKILYVPLPPPEGRASILKALIRRTPLASDVDIDAVATSEVLTGFSGADMAALLREACVESLKESMAVVGAAGAARTEVAARHFQAALRQVQPSVSRKDQRMYDALRYKLRSSRSHLKREEDAPAAAEAAEPMEGAS
jgi:ribosome biogenesis ATPase